MFVGPLRVANAWVVALARMQARKNFARRANQASVSKSENGRRALRSIFRAIKSILLVFKKLLFRCLRVVSTFVKQVDTGSVS